MSEAQKVTNAVRQVLMNEMGLTRESVREEMQKIVAQEAAKAVATMVNEGHLGKMVSEEFKKLLTMGWGNGGRSRVEEIVVTAAKAQAEKFVTEHFSLKVT